LRPAVVHDQVEVSALVSIFALVSRMHALSSSAVVEKAEAVNRMIVDTYFEPNKTFPELRDLLKTHPIDPCGPSARNAVPNCGGLKGR